MPENYEPIPQYGSDVAPVAEGDTSTLDTAKHEAADLKDTAVEQAKDVAATVKDEASVVLGEAKSQAKDLYVQTQHELKEQANTQQQRIAAGLKSVGAELRAMAANSANSGVATDVVQQLSGRLSGAATWLGDRDASAVLTEVKRYARRKPGTFIIGAAIAGIAFGRLTRALAANAAADSEAASARANAAARMSPPALPATTAADAWQTPSVPSPAVTIAEGETPLYTQSTAVHGDALRSEGGRDDRSDSF